LNLVRGSFSFGLAHAFSAALGLQGPRSTNSLSPQAMLLLKAKFPFTHLAVDIISHDNQLRLPSLPSLSFHAAP